MKKLILVLGILGVVGIVGIGWWQYALMPANTKDITQRQFTIAKGDGVREIARKLRDQGLIRDQVAFFLLVKQLGIEKRIQAGSYNISPSLSAAELAKKLMVGLDDTRITIPEGWRSEQIVEYLAGQKIDGTWDPEVELTKWRQEEGKYFPETYQIPKQMKVEEVRELMKQTFSRNITDQMKADAEKNDLTVDQVVILASLVEREGKTDEDRPIIAGILLNRLAKGMSLDVDATVQYAIGYTHADGWWRKNLTEADIRFKSPYNTYLNPGLPPGPICNPGLAAIKAVIYPAKTDYLFYLTGKDGRMHYARTNEEHNQNVTKYL